MPAVAFPVVNTKLVAYPSMDYYIRKDGHSSPILGPVSLTVAQAGARRYSLDENMGNAQVYTIVGNRRGDPPQLQPTIHVLSTYQSGKLLIGGRVADTRARLNLPPSI